MSRWAHSNEISASSQTPRGCKRRANLHPSTALIQLLADRGASLEAVNQTGQTPLAMTQVRTRQQDQEALVRLKTAEDLLRKLGASK